MKSYKKTLLAVSLLATVPLLVAAENDDKTIYVTTFEDEDGENTNACSLREAITAAEQNKPYGGCSAGKTHASVTDIIQLEAGTYKLKKPLRPNSQVSLFGHAATNWDEKDLITNTYPKRTALTTRIEGDGSFAIFDATQRQVALTLTNLHLSKGFAARGGAINSAGPLNLNRVEIENVAASDTGGAIYLSGVNSALTINNSVISGAKAKSGAAVLAMSCVDNLEFVPRTISINNSSIVRNGDNSTKSILEFCGTPNVEMSTNTVAHNEVSKLRNSAVLKFTGDSDPSIPQSNSILSKQSSLKLLSNTIVNNRGYTTFLYDNIGSKNLSYNILAYNDGVEGGGSCRHWLGEIPNDVVTGLSLYSNALIKGPLNHPNGFCDMPYTVLGDQTTQDLAGISQNSIMVDKTAEKDVSGYTAFMPMYFLINPKDNKLVDLTGNNATGCSLTDQRGVTRLVDSVLLLDKDTKNTCDIGSTELVKLAASDMVSTNSSQVVMLKGLEDERDFFKKLVEDKNTRKEFLTYYKIRLDEFNEKIKTYQLPENLKYRMVYIDILKNAIPQQSNDGSHAIGFFDTNLYDIDAEAIGTGPDMFASGIVEDLPKEKDPKLVCEWKPDLQQLVMYKLDGERSASGDFSYCKYTIRLKSDPSNVKSTGLVQAVFSNIAPIAKDVEYTLDWGTEQRVKLDLLKHAHDDGDGKETQSNYPVGKKPFCNVHVNSKWDSICLEDPQSIPAPIKLGKIDTNLVVEAQYQAPCPDNTRTMCYGGDIYMKPKNNYNKFNYSFTYQVFDSDGELSNEATVRLINTATTSKDTRSGGGSLGWLSIAGLFSLALMRRRKI